MMVFSKVRVAVMVLAIVAVFTAVYFAVQYLRCPCSVACICDPCLCGDLK